MINKKNLKKQKIITWKNLIFPRPFHKVRNISILGLLLGLRLIIGSPLMSFSLGPTVISISWVILFVTGFIFGPVIGLLFGAIADTIGWLFNGAGFYMWEYSIQEPIICFLAGLIGILYILTKERKNKWVNFAIFQFFLITFCTIGITMAYVYSSAPIHSQISPKSLRISIAKWLNSSWMIFIVIPLFYIISSITYFLIWKKSIRHAHIATYVGIMVITIWAIFSWIYGPWAEVRFWERKFGITWRKKHDIYIIYKWFLIIRVFKSCLVVPIEIILTTSILIVLEKILITNKSQY